MKTLIRTVSAAAIALAAAAPSAHAMSKEETCAVMGDVASVSLKGRQKGLPKDEMLDMYSGVLEDENSTSRKVRVSIDLAFTISPFQDADVDQFGQLAKMLCIAESQGY